MKHIKLFENFINEELSPELKKRTYDAMMKIANDNNAIDNQKRRDQAYNIMKSLSPAVEKLRNELEVNANKVFATEGVKVLVYDYGLTNNKHSMIDTNGGYVELTVTVKNTELLYLVICKDKYQKGKVKGSTTEQLYGNRAFVNTLKKLIVQIQNDEIPGDEKVPTNPISLTPQGSLDNVPKEDVISRYGTGGDRGNFSGLPSQDTEAGQMARGR